MPRLTHQKPASKTSGRHGGACRSADGFRQLQATNRDTPPKDVCAVGRSPGWRVIVLAGPSQRLRASGQDGEELTAYSCGGSSGIAQGRTGFPLSFRQTHRKNLRHLIIAKPVRDVNRDITISLYAIHSRLPSAVPQKHWQFTCMAIATDKHNACSALGCGSAITAPMCARRRLMGTGTPDLLEGSVRDPHAVVLGRYGHQKAKTNPRREGSRNIKTAKLLI